MTDTAEWIIFWIVILPVAVVAWGFLAAVFWVLLQIVGGKWRNYM
jgi:hypothetical protein